MQICLVVNFFQQPFRFSNSFGEVTDADRVNKHGNRILLINNAGNLGGAKNLMPRINKLSLEDFPTVVVKGSSGSQVGTKLTQTLLSQVDSVKIILTGHGERNVPFIFDDSSGLVDTWLLMKGLLKLLAAPAPEGLGLRNMKSIRLSLPICYGVYGDFDDDNDSICYELARYFTYDSVMQKVRQITTGDVTITGVKNVTYGLPHRGFPERSDYFQNLLDEEMERSLNPPSKQILYWCALHGVDLTEETARWKEHDRRYGILVRGGSYSRGTWHGSQRFNLDRGAVKQREAIRDSLGLQVKEDDKYFGKHKGNKAIITIGYPSISQYELSMVHKYSGEQLMTPVRKALNVMQDVKMNKYNPMS